MIFYKKNLLIGLIFISLCHQSYAQSTNSNIQEELKAFNQTISVGKSKAVKALINVNGGELIIAGNSNELADVSFSYLDRYWNPSVSFTELPEQGKLVIKSNANFADTNLKDKNKCTVALNKSLNYALGIELGAGIVNINLDGYKVNRALMRLGVGSFEINLANTNIPLLKVEAGVGEAIINLAGKRDVDLLAEISAGIGEMTIIVPSDVGVKFKISGFLGDIDAPDFRKENKIYTNQSYANSNIKMEFDVTGAIGSIKIIQQ